MDVATKDEKPALDAKQQEAFLATARRRFDAAAEEEKELRYKFQSDLRFASPDGDEQWDPQVKQQREAAGRPAMAFPRCHTFVQQVSNQARQQKPSIKISPRLDEDQDTADVYEGLARYIQYTSDAEVAYETAIEYSAGASFGYFRFLTEYADDESDDLNLVVKPVLDPLQVYGVLVPSCFGRAPKWAFVVEEMPREEYQLQYPDSEVASINWSDAGKRAGDWITDDSVRIAEYWYVEEQKVEGKRKPQITVKFCKINGVEVLEGSETTWVGNSIPIIAVLGKQMIKDGKPMLFSVVRPQKSAQQLINYSKTRIAETLSIQPVSPFIAAEGQLEGHEAEWQNMNKVLTPTLTYKPTDVNGQPVPAPTRQVYEPPIVALSNFVMQEIDDMKATTGIFDASLGAQGNETSGTAIQARQIQGSMSTMHFLDNLGRALKKGGEMIVELIPKIYDSAREIQILGKDEEPRVAKINQDYEENGKKKHHNLSKEKFVPIISMAPTFDSKRLETYSTLQTLVQAAPNLLPIFGDVMFKNSDMAGADIVADRFKKQLPPNLQDDGGQAPIPPQAQAQIQQLNQHNQALNAAAQTLEKQLGQLQHEKMAKIVEHQGRMEEIAAKAQADMDLEDKKLATSIAVAEINTKAQILGEREAALRDLEAQLHSQAHDLALQQQQHANAQDMAAQQFHQQQEMHAQQPDQTQGQPPDAQSAQV